MTTFCLCLSREDVDQDQHPDILIEFIKKEREGDKVTSEVMHAAYVSSSKKDSDYDTVDAGADVDSQKGVSREDDKLLLELAQAFANIRI